MRKLMVIAVLTPLMLVVTALLAWQVSVAVRLVRQGFSKAIVLEGLLSWAVQIIFVLGLFAAAIMTLLVLARRAPQNGLEEDGEEE